MSTSPTPPKDIAAIARQLPDAQKATTESFDAKTGEGYSEKLVDAIEMIGEEQAGQLPDSDKDGVTPGMRYLHSSRTIHQLVTDRNRAVGIFMGVASLLLTASSMLLNVRPDTAQESGGMIIPQHIVQRWCLPVTFGTLTVMALLVAFLLIRTRTGLIYEVAKMNALLGLPIGRVKRIGFLSIFFIMMAMISLAGGACGALFSVHMLYLAEAEHIVLPAALIGVGITVFLLVLYIVTVMHTTSDQRLQQMGK